MRQFLTLLLLVGSLFAKPITTNGTGGGNIANPATWAGGLTFANGDAVTIAPGDTLTNPVSTSATFGSLTCATPGNGTLQIYGTFVLNADTSTCNIVADGAAISGSGGFQIPTTSGATLSIHNSTCNACGQMIVTGMAGDATFSIVSSRFTNGSYVGGYGQIYGTGWGAKTGGTREIKNSYFDTGIRISAASSFLDVGLVFQGNTLWIVGSSLVANYGLYFDQLTFSGTNFDYNIIAGRDTTGFAGGQPWTYLPAGNVNHTAIFGSNASNDSACDGGTHFNWIAFGANLSTDNLVYNLKDSYMEPDCGVTNSNGIEINGSTHPTIVNVTNTVNNNGKDGFASYLITHVANTSCASVSCTTINADHVTSGSHTGTLYLESTQSFAGQFNITNSILFNDSSASCSAGWQTGAGTMPSGTWVLNFVKALNCSTALDSGTGLSGKVTINNPISAGSDPQLPSVSTSKFNLLSWCQTLDGSATTWALCMAHFAAGDSGYTPQAFFTAMRTAFTPGNTAYHSNGLAGTYVGAFDPSTPAPSSMTLSGVTLKGAAIK